MTLPDTTDPNFFCDDIAATREEDEAAAEDFYEVATDVEGTSNTSAGLNEGEEDHVVRDGMGFNEDDEAFENFDSMDGFCDDEWRVGAAQTIFTSTTGTGKGCGQQSEG